jgi:hypothetical protein
LTLYFVFYSYGPESGTSLYVVKRTSIAVPFNILNSPLDDHLVPGFPKGKFTGAPSLSADGQSLYYDDNRVIHRRSWSGSEWIADETLAEIGVGKYPAISADGRTLFFARPDGDHENIWSATRVRASGPFDTPIAWRSSSLQTR